MGAENVLHVYPPAGKQDDGSKYFAQLGRQCGFAEAVQDSYEWCQQMAQRLDNDETLFFTGQWF
ncbi:MAG: hypothetical protein R3E89_13145 [Thiolinea sp.]